MEDFQEVLSRVLLTLEKLRKILKHSDPSAEVKKKVVWEKYLTQMTSLVETIKRSGITWVVLEKEVIKTIQADHLRVHPDAQPIIRNRVLKDLNERLFPKVDLPDFSSEPKRKKIIPSVKKKKVSLRDTREDQYKKDYSKNDLMDMVKKAQNQRKARQELSVFIKNVKTFGTKRLESKIQAIAKQAQQEKH
ncbi:MAG: hypothetical protein ACI86H_001030 [bacterium]|jgi:uncharacterized protein YecE (DUF72 family)